MEKIDYLPRLIDRKIESLLETFGAICIEGPKWCGKTWTGMYHSNSSVMLGDPAGNFQNRQLAMLNPSLVLEGAPPRGRKYRNCGTLSDIMPIKMARKVYLS